MTHLEHDDDALVVGTDNVRQGVTGHNVRYVLAFGLVGIIVVFIALSMIS